MKTLDVLLICLILVMVYFMAMMHMTIEKLTVDGYQEKNIQHEYLKACEAQLMYLEHTLEKNDIEYIN